MTCCSSLIPNWSGGSIRKIPHKTSNWCAHSPRGDTMSDLSPGASSPLRRVANGKTAENGKPDPLEDMLHALQAMRAGDFSVRMTGDHLGIEGKIADTFNEIVAANQRMAQQLDRVGQRVGKEGKTDSRVGFTVVSGAWGEMETSSNPLI